MLVQVHVHVHGELQNKIMITKVASLDVTCTASPCYKIRDKPFCCTE
jgi:hypothetical protein